MGQIVSNVVDVVHYCVS